MARIPVKPEDLLQSVAMDRLESAFPGDMGIALPASDVSEPAQDVASMLPKEVVDVPMPEPKQPKRYAPDSRQVELESVLARLKEAQGKRNEMQKRNSETLNAFQILGGRASSNLAPQNAARFAQQEAQVTGDIRAQEELARQLEDQQFQSAERQQKIELQGREQDPESQVSKDFLGYANALMEKYGLPKFSQGASMADVQRMMSGLGLGVRSEQADRRLTQQGDQFNQTDKTKRETADANNATRIEIALIQARARNQREADDFKKLNPNLYSRIAKSVPQGTLEALDVGRDIDGQIAALGGIGEAVGGAGESAALGIAQRFGVDGLLAREDIGLLDKRKVQLRQDIGRMVAKFLTSDAGKAMTSNEEKRILGAVGADNLSPFIGPEQFSEALKIMKRANRDAVMQAASLAGGNPTYIDPLMQFYGLDSAAVPGRQSPQQMEEKQQEIRPEPYASPIPRLSDLPIPSRGPLNSPGLQPKTGDAPAIKTDIQVKEPVKRNYIKVVGDKGYYYDEDGDLASETIYGQ